MNVPDLEGARRLALRMVLGQWAAAVAIALLFLFWRGLPDAVAALVGGGIGVAAGLAMVGFMFRRSAQGDPQRIMRNAFKGEAAKLGLTVVLFVLALNLFELSALPLFVGYIVAILAHWVALARF